MEYFQPKVRSGLFILIAAAIFVVTIFSVGGLLDKFKTVKQVRLRVANSLQVDEGTEVLYRGKKIGRVMDVTFSEDDANVIIICAIEPKVKLYKGTKSQIGDKSALGGKLIELIPPQVKPGEKPTELGPDDFIEEIPAANLAAAIAKLNQLVEENAGTIKHILEQFDGILTENRENIRLTVEDARQIAAKVREYVERDVKAVLDNVNALIDDAQNVMATVDTELKANSEKVKSLVDASKQKVQEIGDLVSEILKTNGPKVSELLDRVDDLVAQVQADVGRVSGDASTLLNDVDRLVLDNYGNVTESLNSLKITLRNFELFSEKVADNPSALVWGGDAQKATPISDEDLFEIELRNSGRLSRIGKEKD